MPRQYHKNPRQITTKQMTMLAHDLAELGDLSGIVHDLNTDELIGGNQRSKIFRLDECEIQLSEQYDAPDEQGTVALGYVIWQGKKYTYRQVRWDTKTAEKANIVANKAGGTWDFDILGNEWEIDELLEWGFEPFELGLDDTEAEEPTEDPGAQVDRAEELREKWDVHPGQMWQLGAHRLICGDCTDPAVVERVMGGEKAELALNDPPYGMRLDADFSGMVNKLDFAREKGVKRGTKYENVIGDNEDFDAGPLVEILRDVPEQVWFGADYYAGTLGNTEHGGSWMVWDKRLDESADKMYGSCFELIWSKAKHKRDILRHKWAGIFGTEHEPQRGRQHPNQKPVVLYADILSRLSSEGDIVFDGFSGSGTTLIACEQLGRRCRAVEISPGYVAVALQRWADMTGQTPELVEEKAPTIAGAGK
jgi:DNA modification methylase